MMRWIATLSTIILALAITAVMKPVLSCTGILLHNADGSVVHGRTVEFGYFIDTDVVIVPRGYEVVGTTPDGNGLKFKTKYAAVGVIAFDVLGLMDGLNEKGLGFGTFYFPSFAGYAAITAENRDKAVSPSQFGNWVLGQFGSVDEVKAAIERGDVVIAPTPAKGFGPDAPPFHYIVYDRDGASIVIEPIDGKLVVHDNPLGTLTNSPNFDWHMTNLQNYVSLKPRDVPPVKVGDKTFKQLGLGSGMQGLPGDFTPPSRFVRAAVFSATAVPSKDASEGVQQVFHILNNFDIPVGISRETRDGEVYTDYTMITTARDPQNLRCYYKTYQDQTIRMVDLQKFDLDSKTVKKLKTKSDQPIVDMSDQLN